MPRVVLCNKCHNDRECVKVCPVGAFHAVDDHVVINPDVCIDCGACEMACPYGAIVEDDDSAAASFVEQNKKESSENPSA
jgi:ferredoxin